MFNWLVNHKTRTCPGGPSRINTQAFCGLGHSSKPKRVAEAGHAIRRSIATAAPQPQPGSSGVGIGGQSSAEAREYCRVNCQGRARISMGDGSMHCPIVISLCQCLSARPDLSLSNYTCRRIVNTSAFAVCRRHVCPPFIAISCCLCVAICTHSAAACCGPCSFTLPVFTRPRESFSSSQTDCMHAARLGKTSQRLNPSVYDRVVARPLSRSRGYDH